MPTVAFSRPMSGISRPSDQCSLAILAPEADVLDPANLCTFPSHDVDGQRRLPERHHEPKALIDQPPRHRREARKNSTLSRMVTKTASIRQLPCARPQPNGDIRPGKSRYVACLTIRILFSPDSTVPRQPRGCGHPQRRQGFDRSARTASDRGGAGPAFDQAVMHRDRAGPDLPDQKRRFVRPCSRPCH